MKLQFVALAAACLLAVAVPAQAATFSVPDAYASATPSSPMTSFASPVMCNPIDSSYHAYTIDLVFNPSLLSVTGVDRGTATSGPPPGETTGFDFSLVWNVEPAGHLRISMFSNILGPGSLGSGAQSIAIVRFAVIGANGTSSELTLSSVQANEANQMDLLSGRAYIDADADLDGYTVRGGDCDDAHRTVYPGAPAVCDGITTQHDCSTTDSVPTRYVSLTGHDDFTNAKGVLYPTGSDCRSDRPCRTIQHAVDAACTSQAVSVGIGTFDENVYLGKAGIRLTGAGMNSTIVKGPKGHDGASTVWIQAAGVVVENVQVTRDGNNPTDWLSALNSNGVAFGAGVTGSTLQNAKVIHNRNGVLMNYMSANTIQDCVITQNRTGMQIVGGMQNVVIRRNTITDNTTMGILFNGTAGGPSTIDATGAVITDNDISGNWFSQIEARDNVAGLIDVSGNWYGSATLNILAETSHEDAYVDQCPTWYGGTAVPPSPPHTAWLRGTRVATLDYTPWLVNGAHDVSNLNVDDDSPQVGTIGRIQEGVNLAAATAPAIPVVNVKPGTYTEQVRVTKSLHLAGADRATTSLVAPAVMTTDPATSLSPAYVVLAVDATGGSFEMNGMNVKGPGPTGCASLHYGLFVMHGAANVHDNAFTDIRDQWGGGVPGQNSGCQNGVALRYGSRYYGFAATGSIANNTFVNYQKGGIVVDGPGSSATITDNTLTGVPGVNAQNGIQISREAANVVVGTPGHPNTISAHRCEGNSICGLDGDQASGILFFEAGAGSTVSHNVLSGNDGGIYVDAAGTTTLTANAVTASVYEGVIVKNGTTVLDGSVGHNVISGGVYGLEIANASTVTASGINVGGTTGASVLLDAGTPNVTITDSQLAPTPSGLAVRNNSSSTPVFNCDWWGQPTGPAPLKISGSANVNGYLMGADYNDDPDGDNYASCTLGGFQPAGKGFGDCLELADLCGGPTDFACGAHVHPNAAEACDQIDSNCNGVFTDVSANGCRDANDCTQNDVCELVGSTYQCTYNRASTECGLVATLYYDLSDGTTDVQNPAKPADVAHRVQLDHDGTTTTNNLTTAGSVNFGSGFYHISVFPLARTGTPVAEVTNAVTSYDATKIAKYIVHKPDTVFSPFMLKLADVSANGSVTSYDAAIISTRAVSPSYLMPIVATNGEWAYWSPSCAGSSDPIHCVASETAYLSSTSNTYAFEAGLYGDVTLNWTNIDSGALAPALDAEALAGAAYRAAHPNPPVAITHDGNPALLFVADGPRRNSDGTFSITFGIQNADGIAGLDINLDLGENKVAIRNIEPAGIAENFALEHHAEGTVHAIAMYDAYPMAGSGPFLKVTYALRAPVTGHGFTLAAEANEGQIPLAWATSVPNSKPRFDTKH